jgi:hypothetical protein
MTLQIYSIVLMLTNFCNFFCVKFYYQIVAIFLLLNKEIVYFCNIINTSKNVYIDFTG